MKTLNIHGIFTNAVIYATDNVENAIDDYAIAQIQQLCDFEAAEGNVIRVMPDVHPGKGCVVGLTMRLLNDKVMPNLVGVDIGCGVLVTALADYREDFTKLDNVIAEKVPSGFAVHRDEREYAALEELCCAKHMRLSRARMSLGTLGGGNHFVEVAQGRSGQRYLIVHSGSRHLGKEVCEWYLKLGRRNDVPYELTYLTGDLREQYLHDMHIVQAFAQANRFEIARAIIKGMEWGRTDSWESIHNYIDFDESVPVLRKGAIAAGDGKRVVIPSNMRDGSIIGVGKGNPEWNWSAPHGSGRVSSRNKVRQTHTLSEFKKTMNGIFSTCVSEETLDEAPFAYRAQEDILGVLGETVEVRDILRPVYNF